MNNTTNTLPALRGNLAELPLAPGKALALQNIGNAFALAELVAAHTTETPSARRFLLCAEK